MTLKQATSYLQRRSKGGSVYGLSRIKQLLKRLGMPQSQLKFIHIAGTNGKGSVCAMLSSVLSQCGYTTGCYTSPAPFGRLAQYQIDGQPISPEDFVAQVAEIATSVLAMELYGLEPPTGFELETALALSYFAQKRCDLVVLETGLGGKEDATNVVDTTILEIFTPIALDHTQLLGDTIPQIAAQKAGILKPGVPAVSGVQLPAAATVLEETTKRLGCPLSFFQESKLRDITYGIEYQRFSYGEWKDVTISLGGKYQVENAALVLEAVAALRAIGYTLPESAVRQGLENAAWPGRFSVLSHQPLILLDGAHNPNGAKALAESIRQLCPGMPCQMILGMLRDKDYPAVAEILAPLAARIVTTQTPDNPRALSAQELAGAVSAYHPKVTPIASVAAAVDDCIQLAAPDSMILICGSLSFLQEAQQAVSKALSQKGGSHGTD